MNVVFLSGSKYITIHNIFGPVTAMGIWNHGKKGGKLYYVTGTTLWECCLALTQCLPTVNQWDT